MTGDYDDDDTMTFDDLGVSECPGRRRGWQYYDLAFSADVLRVERASIGVMASLAALCASNVRKITCVF